MDLPAGWALAAIQERRDLQGTGSGLGCGRGRHHGHEDLQANDAEASGAGVVGVRDQCETVVMVGGGG